MQLVLGMLANNGQGGGLAGLMEKFQSAGLGEQMNSWVGTGQNLPVSPDQLGGVFGQDQMSQMAEQHGHVHRRPGLAAVADAAAGGGPAHAGRAGARRAGWVIWATCSVS